MMQRRQLQNVRAQLQTSGVLEGRLPGFGSGGAEASRGCVGVLTEGQREKPL